MGNPVVVVRENKTRLVVAREGKKGDVGIPGPGLEDGGTTGQVLRKASNLDQDTEWHTLTASDVGADASGAASAAQSAAASDATTKANAAQAAAIAASAAHTHASTHGSGGSDPVTLAQSQVTGLSTALSGKADLVSGTIPTAQMPPLVITETWVVASQAEMLALTAQRGDVAIRSDLGKTFILTNEVPGTLGSWLELVAAGKVVAVNGQTGSVVLGASDVGADASGSASAAQSAAISAAAGDATSKANTAESNAKAASAQRSSNLSDLASASTARSNLGLGTAATKDTGTGTSNVILGNDARLSDPRTPTAHASSHASGGSDPVTPLSIGARAENRVTFSNADYSIPSTARFVGQTGTMSAPRTSTLPPANSVASGTEIVVADESGTVSSTNTLTIARAGSDTINGGTSVVIGGAYGWRRLISNGVNGWIWDAGVLRSSNNLSDVASASTALANLGGYPGTFPLKSGVWFGTGGGSMGATTVINTQLYAMLVPVQQTMTIDRLGFTIPTGGSGSSGSVVRLGIYKMAANLVDCTLLLDAGTIDGTQAAGSYAITVSQQLTPGIYAFCYVPQGAPATNPKAYLSLTGASPFPWLCATNTQVNATNNGCGMRTAAAVTGALPASVSLSRYGYASTMEVRVA